MNDGRSELPLQRISRSGVEIEKETIVEETAIQLDALDSDGNMYTHTTLLATPVDLIELHAGHLVAEGYISPTVAVDSFTHETTPYHVVEFHGLVEIAPRERLVTSSCGACNHPDLLIDNISGNLQHQPFKDLELILINNALKSLTHEMKLFQASGGSHGAGLYVRDVGLRYVSEDIGRHNAVDKTIGKAILDQSEQLGTSMLLLSGRCGWDIVAKAVRSGIPAIASLGAMSSAAIQLAREHGLILFGFVKNDGAWKVG